MPNTVTNQPAPPIIPNSSSPPTAKGGVASGNLDQPSKAEINRGTDALVSALAAGGAMGMDAPVAVVQRYLNNKALLETILKTVAPNDRTAEMKKFVEAMAEAAVKYTYLMNNADKVQAQTGLDLTGVVAQDDGTTAILSLVYTSKDMYSELAQIATSFLADGMLQGLKITDQAVADMQDAADNRLKSAMIGACVSIGMGVAGGAIAVGGASVALGSNKAGDNSYQRLFDPLTQDAAGVQAKLTALDGFNKSMQSVTDGTSKTVTAGYDQSAFDRDAQVKLDDGANQSNSTLMQATQNLGGTVNQSISDASQQALNMIESENRAEAQVLG